MPGLHVHRSNRLERLADRLGEILRDPLPDPLQAEVITVQSLGMRRWLQLSLADRLDIAMNCEFPFPETLAQHVFRAAFPEQPKSSGFTRDLLLWRIHSVLPALLERRDFAALRQYIGEGELRALKQFQLSRQLATLFDRHLAFRPEELLSWQTRRADENADWQIPLWRELAKGWEDAHPPALLARLQQRIAQGKIELPGIPSRVSMFGISSLPPFYIHLLAALARCVELHLFLFEPTDQFWADVQSPREQRRFLRRHAKPEQTAADFHLEVGNALLASLGKPGRLFARAVQDLEPLEEGDLFEGPAEATPNSQWQPATVLGQIQADIFTLADRSEEEHIPIETGDRSLQVHCCHGPMRELEVLHDRLLDLFEWLPGLTPKDILVTMPDVEPYAPFIEAVFGAPDQEGHRIPFTIADRSAAAESVAAQTFLQLLALQGSRFGAASVLALLDSAPLRRRFGFSRDDLELIRGWVEETNIRWGIDAPHRAGFDLPPFTQNSWRSGLDRMLLGYALASETPQVFEDLVPVTGIEGHLADVLGQFADFADKLFDLIPKLSEPRTLGAWSRTLAHLLQTFLDDSEESAQEMHRLRGALEKLGELENVQRDPVPFEVIHAHLTHTFANTDSARGFLVGHVTFCSLKPMRSVPFRVICMLGLDDTAFPRRDPSGALDQLAGTGEAGRSRRDEDRQVFLETILSARDALLLSYSGLSPTDNSEAPPSVVVSELLDYVDSHFSTSQGAPRDRVLIKHKLQPFNPEYFRGSDRLFSYSQENCQASLRSTASRSAGLTLVDGPLREPGEEWLRIELQQLQRFFRHPTRFYLTDVLNIRLPEAAAILEESEPMDLPPFDRWTLQHGLTASFLASTSHAGDLQALRSTGILPAGHAGDAALAKITGVVSKLVQRVKNAVTDQTLSPQPFSFRLGKWTLHGSLNDLYPSGLVRTFGWDITPKELINTWLEHLVLNSLPDFGADRHTRLFAADTTIRFKPIPESEILLEALLGNYAEGLRSPLPFFPEASHELARRTLKPGKKETRNPEDAALDIWRAKEGGKIEIALCYGEREPLDAQWRDLALRFFKPMIEHMSEEDEE